MDERVCVLTDWMEFMLKNGYDQNTLLKTKEMALRANRQMRLREIVKKYKDMITRKNEYYYNNVFEGVFPIFVHAPNLKRKWNIISSEVKTVNSNFVIVTPIKMRNATYSFKNNTLIISIKERGYDMTFKDKDTEISSISLSNIVTIDMYDSRGKEAFEFNPKTIWMCFKWIAGKLILQIMSLRLRIVDAKLSCIPIIQHTIPFDAHIEFDDIFITNDTSYLMSDDAYTSHLPNFLFVSMYAKILHQLDTVSYKLLDSDREDMFSSMAGVSSYGVKAYTMLKMLIPHLAVSLFRQYIFRGPITSVIGLANREGFFKDADAFPRVQHALVNISTVITLRYRNVGQAGTNEFRYGMGQLPMHYKIQPARGSYGDNRVDMWKYESRIPMTSFPLMVEVSGSPHLKRASVLRVYLDWEATDLAYTGIKIRKNDGTFTDTAMYAFGDYTDAYNFKILGNIGDDGQCCHAFKGKIKYRPVFLIDAHDVLLGNTKQVLKYSVSVAGEKFDGDVHGKLIYQVVNGTKSQFYQFIARTWSEPKEASFLSKGVRGIKWGYARTFQSNYESVTECAGSTDGAANYVYVDNDKRVTGPYSKNVDNFMWPAGMQKKNLYNSPNPEIWGVRAMLDYNLNPIDGESDYSFGAVSSPDIRTRSLCNGSTQMGYTDGWLDKGIFGFTLHSWGSAFFLKDSKPHPIEAMFHGIIDAINVTGIEHESFPFIIHALETHIGQEMVYPTDMSFVPVDDTTNSWSDNIDALVASNIELNNAISIVSERVKYVTAQFSDLNKKIDTAINDERGILTYLSGFAKFAVSVAEIVFPTYVLPLYLTSIAFDALNILDKVNVRNGFVMGLLNAITHKVDRYAKDKDDGFFNAMTFYSIVPVEPSPYLKTLLRGCGSITKWCSPSELRWSSGPARDPIGPHVYGTVMRISGCVTKYTVISHAGIKQVPENDDSTITRSSDDSVLDVIVSVSSTLTADAEKLQKETLAKTTSMKYRIPKHLALTFQNSAFRLGSMVLQYNTYVYRHDVLHRMEFKLNVNTTIDIQELNVYNVSTSKKLYVLDTFWELAQFAFILNALCKSDSDTIPDDICLDPEKKILKRFDGEKNLFINAMLDYNIFCTYILDKNASIDYRILQNISS